jgi:hypothetical protein
MGEWLARVGATVFLAVVCEGCLGFAVLGTLVAGTCFGPTLTLGVDFVVLPFLPVVSRSFRVGLEATGLGVVLGGGGWLCGSDRPPFILVPSVLSVLPLEGWKSW